MKKSIKQSALYILLTIVSSLLAVVASTLMLVFTLIVNIIEAIFLVIKEYLESIISQFLGAKELNILKTKHEETLKTINAIDEYSNQLIHALSQETIDMELVKSIQYQLSQVKQQLNTDIKPK